MCMVCGRFDEECGVLLLGLGVWWIWVMWGVIDGFLLIGGSVDLRLCGVWCDDYGWVEFG